MAQKYSLKIRPPENQIRIQVLIDGRILIVLRTKNSSSILIEKIFNQVG